MNDHLPVGLAMNTYDMQKGKILLFQSRCAVKRVLKCGSLLKKTVSSLQIGFNVPLKDFKCKTSE